MGTQLLSPEFNERFNKISNAYFDKFKTHLGITFFSSIRGRWYILPFINQTYSLPFNLKSYVDVSSESDDMEHVLCTYENQLNLCPTKIYLELKLPSKDKAKIVRNRLKEQYPEAVVSIEENT